MITILLRFILPDSAQFVLSHLLGVIFVILPIVNHFGIFIAIRRHNKQLGDALSGPNASVLFRREKKAAIDMIIVIAVLLLCLVPLLSVNTLKFFFSDKFELLYVWSTTIIFLNSSINPVIHVVRNSEIRNAIKSVMTRKPKCVHQDR